MGAQATEPVFTLGDGPTGSVRRALFAAVARPLERALAFDRLEAGYRVIAGAADAASFVAGALARLRIAVRVSDEDLARIPASGPLLLAGNHPFGGIEGIVLAAVIARRRPDVRLLANRLLCRVPELREIIFPVEVFGGPGAARANAAAFRGARAWLRGGGALVVFPAGEVSHLHPGRWLVTDPPWQRGVARLLRGSGAKVAPVYFPGANGALFQGAGLLHPGLRTALLPRELLNKEGREIEMRVGPPVAVEDLERLGDDGRIVEALRLRTYALAERGGRPAARRRPGFPGLPARRLPEVAPAAPRGMLAAEIAALPADRRLVVAGDHEVWCAEAGQAPELLREIGRQRELAFRAVGEGTGRALDLDRFDATYRHLILWDRAAGAVAGAYRLGEADRLLRTGGTEGLYTSTLFAYDPAFFERLGPALELGRSFVAPAYQKSFGALLLLWRGIGRFLVGNPRFRHLFGPVSISDSYLPLSRELMVASLRATHRDAQLERLVRPRTPIAPRWRRHWDRPPAELLCGGLEEVGTLVADLEADGKGIPILLRQYLKLDARAVAFNRDPRFSQVWDCLLVVDLARTQDSLLARYLGREGLAAYRAHQAAGAEAGAARSA